MIGDRRETMKFYAKKKMSNAPAMPLDIRNIHTMKDSCAANGKYKASSLIRYKKVSFKFYLSPSLRKDLQCISRGNKRAHCVINRFRWKQYAKAKEQEER